MSRARQLIQEMDVDDPSQYLNRAYSARLLYCYSCNSDLRQPGAVNRTYRWAWKSSPKTVGGHYDFFTGQFVPDQEVELPVPGRYCQDNSDKCSGCGDTLDVPARQS